MSTITIPLTDVDNLLLEVLRENGGWMSRSDIQESLGGYSQYHSNRLERLAEYGLVEIERRVRGVAQKVYYYRAV